MIREKIIERRNHKRYKAIEGAYAAISPNSNKLGPITDISVGGLCFKSIDNGNGSKNSLTQCKESILLSSIGHYARKLPFRTVSEYETYDTPTFSSMRAIKSHIQFKDLNLRQLFDLDNFLRNNVSNQVEKFPKPYNTEFIKESFQD